MLPYRRRRPPRSLPLLRGFSLIEVMIVVAILGVMAALAAPSLLAEMQKARLASAADEVATFVARAQTEAMVTRRCVRVTFRNAGARTLVAERLNSFDCDNNPDTAPTIDGTATIWVPIATTTIDTNRISVFLDGTNGRRVPNESRSGLVAPGATATGFTDEIRFRPNGRVFSNDLTGTTPNVTDDDAVISLVHADLPATGNKNRRKVLVNGHGLICVLDRGTDPPGTAPNFNCP